MSDEPRKRGRPKSVGGLKNCLQNQWMQDYLLPNKHFLVVRDTPYGKRGKAIFIVDKVRSNMAGTKGTVVCLCICDILIDPETGTVVRKPNNRAAKAGDKGGRKVMAYEQVFIPLDMVKEVCDNMLILSGSPPAVEAKVKLEEAVKAVERTEQQVHEDDMIRRFRL